MTEKNSTPVLLIKKLCENAVIPSRATAGSAGADLCACINEPLVINPGERILVPTGIAAAIPDNTAGMIYARSSLGAKHGIALSNGVGVIDSDYRGEIKVGLCNFSQSAYTIQPGERIAQLVLHPVVIAEIKEAVKLNDTQRGTGGFGSTGRL